MHQAHSPQVPPARYTAPTQPGSKGGGQQGSERHDDNWWNRTQTAPHHNVRSTAPVPQTEPQAPQHASVPRAWTARSMAPKTRTTVTCRGATPTTTTAPAIEAEGGHGTHTPQGPHTRCTAHSRKNPDEPTQRPKGTPTTDTGWPTQRGPAARATGGQRPQHWLDPAQDHTPTLRTDYSSRTSNRTTNTTPCRRTPSQDRTEYSAQNTDHCQTPQHEAQHHKDGDNAPRPEPHTGPLATEATQPRALEDHTHEAPLSASSGTSSTALDTHSKVSTPAEAPDPPPESLPSGLDIPPNHDTMDLDNDPLQDSIRRVLQAASATHQRPTWSLYRALNETDQRITGTAETETQGRTSWSFDGTFKTPANSHRKQWWCREGKLKL